MSGGGATSEDRPETGVTGGGRHAGDRPAGAGDDPATAGDGQPGGDGRRRGRAAGPSPIAVSWNERQRCPVSFVWRRRRYRVERVLETWVLETGWWKDEGHVSRSYWRVRAEGHVFDLRYDRLSKAWALEQALN
jgi:hypothetical protein